MARIMLPARVDSCAPAMEFLREHLAADYADHIYEMKGGQLHEIPQSSL